MVEITETEKDKVYLILNSHFIVLKGTLLLICKWSVASFYFLYL